MRLQFKKFNNESGLVLFIVLMTAIVIMIYSLGILTQSMNEINYAQQQIDQITCDQLKKGYFWQWYSTNTDPGAAGPFNITQNGRVYTIKTSKDPITGAHQVICSYVPPQ